MYDKKHELPSPETRDIMFCYRMRHLCLLLELSHVQVAKHKKITSKSQTCIGLKQYR